MELREVMKAGVHFVTEPIPVPDGARIIAQPGARLVGGIRLTAEKGADGLYRCDLSAAGIRAADMPSRGFGRRITPAHNELFVNGRAMHISRYPKTGAFLTITGVGEPKVNEWARPVGALEGGFYYDDDRPAAWRPQRLYAFGYWGYDWAPTRERVEILDTDRRFVRCAPPYGEYELAVGQRFYFFNVMEEVTEPGDYCIDYDNNAVLFRPFDGEVPEEIFLSVCDKPAFALSGTRDVVIDGFTIEAFRGNGMTLRDCRDVRITNCTFRNLGNRAINVDDSAGVTIAGCEFYDTGDGGVAFYCGDRRTLTPAGCSVERCRFHDIARWDRCYEPPVRLYGVGLKAVGNVIHDCPHSAILYGGNEIDIDGNEIYRVVTETGDAGAIYAGRDFTFRGNTIRNNFIHHVTGSVGFGVMGIYNDDMLCGTKITGNVFYKVQRAVFLGGGDNFLIENNVFIRCEPAIEVDSRGTSPHPVWRKMIDETMRERFYHVDGTDVSAADPPYTDRYPELRAVDAAFRAGDKALIPPSAEIRGNVFCASRRVNFLWDMTETDNVTAGGEEVDLEALRARLTPEQFAVVDDDE